MNQSPEFEIILDGFTLEFLNVFGQRDVLRADVCTRELGLAAPHAVFLVHGFETVLFDRLAFTLVHHKAISFVDSCRTEVIPASCDIARGGTRATPDTAGAHFDLLAVLGALALLFEGSI